MLCSTAWVFPCTPLSNLSDSTRLRQPNKKVFASDVLLRCFLVWFVIGSFDLGISAPFCVVYRAYTMYFFKVVLIFLYPKSNGMFPLERDGANMMFWQTKKMSDSEFSLSNFVCVQS